jgi:hypothetical protein
MKMMKNIIWLFIISLFFMQSCVKEEENIFDDTAAARGQKAVAEYRELLVNAADGWFLDYYPELDHKIGGYAMYLKFYDNGTVDVSCEIETNALARQVETSEFDVIMEQGPIIRFSTYNKVMHYFSEPYASDINGREGDYEFIVMKVEADQIHIKGKKGGNKMILRRNTENINPDTHLTEITDFADIMSEFALFDFIVNNNSIGIASVTDRTFFVDYTADKDDESISYTFTPTGIRFYEPFEINGTTVETFTWNVTNEQYVADQNSNVVLKSFFPDDYQLRYEEFLGRWKFEYYSGTASGWSTAKSTDTVEFIQIKKSSTFRMACDKIFNFPGLIVNFNLASGVISLYTRNTSVNSSGYDIRQCPYDTNAGYLNTSTTSSVGLIGVWNRDNGGERTITFVDNGVWGTYKPDGILLRLFDESNVSMGNYTGNTGGIYRFRTLVLTKID